MTPSPLILVADDDEEWRRLLAFSLQEAGFRVELASDGKSVLPLAGQCRPDGFVLDHDMGDMTGAQVCAAIKSSGEHGGAPVVMLTAHVEVLPALIGGCPPDQFVVKTGSVDELIAVLKGLFPEAAP
ncbi:MAG TPA: hypothetical protein DEB40_14395 [Elusimicrobia bacterium]|nr:hypothetical protein [Elusimicrobiota bacterium]HBT62923.1 hypothetical protein [Elusimicrobiota bacterium]